MAQPITNVTARELPTDVVVEELNIFCLGQYPYISAWFAECVLLKDDSDAPINTVFGEPAYRYVALGRRWKITLDPANPDAFARIVQGEQNAIARLIANIQAGSRTYGLHSTMADEWYAIEAERRAGALPFATIEGSAPNA